MTPPKKTRSPSQPDPWQGWPLEAKQTEAARRYENGATGPELAELFDRGETAIYTWLRATGTKIRPTTAVPELTEHRRHAAIARYLNGEPVTKIAADYNVDRRTIRQWTADRGEPLRPNPATPILTEAQRLEILDERQAGRTVREIAARFPVTPSAIKKIIYPQPKRPRSEPRFTPAERRSAVDRYIRGEPSTSIAIDVGVTPRTVRKWVRNYGEQVRTPKQANQRSRRLQSS